MQNPPTPMPSLHKRGGAHPRDIRRIDHSSGTGESAPARYRMTRQEMVEVLQGTCIYCGGAMGVRQLPEEEFP